MITDEELEDTRRWYVWKIGAQSPCPGWADSKILSLIEEVIDLREKLQYAEFYLEEIHHQSIAHWDSLNMKWLEEFSKEGLQKIKSKQI